MSASAIYSGELTHRRFRPVEHRLAYPIWMLLLDLDELPEILDRHPLFSARRPAPVRFRASDHLDDPELSLADRARDLVGQRTGRRPSGSVRLLTTPRVLGFGYNPVSFFYLYDARSEMVQAAIAEVTNTPWGERHAYVLARDRDDGPIEGRMKKRLHVSPFMRMDQTYEWITDAPGASLAIRIANRERERTVFEAALALRRRPLSRAEMTRALVRHPPQAIATLARIYANALRLKRKGAPIFRHPRSSG